MTTPSSLAVNPAPDDLGSLYTRLSTRLSQSVLPRRHDHPADCGPSSKGSMLHRAAPPPSMQQAATSARKRAHQKSLPASPSAATAPPAGRARGEEQACEQASSPPPIANLLTRWMTPPTHVYTHATASANNNVDGSLEA
jgi:hypothetical protein